MFSAPPVSSGLEPVIDHIVRQSVPVAVSAADLEALMANKDKGGRSTRKVAAKDLKQKRLDKKAKKNAGKQDRII